MLKLVVFDCDGVMFDSRETNRRYYNDLLTAFGQPKMTEEEVDYVHVHNVSDSIRHIFRASSHETLAAVTGYREKLNYSPYLAYMTIEPDLVEFLEYAQSRYKLAISTNRTNTMKVLLQTFRLDHYFERVVTAVDVAHPKPAPDALLDILNHFACPPGQAIYIGDSRLDHDHAKGAGVPFIAFKNAHLPADYHVESFKQICTLPPFAG